MRWTETLQILELGWALIRFIGSIRVRDFRVRLTRVRARARLRVLKHWTADRKVQGSSPTSSRDLFLFWVHSALPQKLSRRFSFVSFRGDVKPLKLA